MIIGDTMAGKTSTLKVLQNTYNHLQKEELKKKQREFTKKKYYARFDTGTEEDDDPGFDRPDFLERHPSCALSSPELAMIKESCKHLGIT
jgi:hypothetical protein